MKHIRIALALCLIASTARADEHTLVLPGGDGPGKGKHVVLVSGDEEYRSEEALPQLAKILSKHHGFKCTVLFAIDKDGTINPNVLNNIPGLDALKTADLMLVSLRFRDLPDDQMKHIAEYVESGKPIVGLRTATHAFLPKTSKTYARYGNNSGEKGWEGGFGKQVLGEKWVNHHGAHGKEGCRGVAVVGQESHPILKGIAAGSIFGTTDVYTVTLPLKGCTPLVLGEVTETLKDDSKAVSGKKNDPMMPIAWTRAYAAENGKVARVFTTTMGASQDLQWEGTRRLIVNGCFWAMGLEAMIPEKSNVEIVGAFEPLPFRNNGFKKGVKPADLGK